MNPRDVPFPTVRGFPGLPKWLDEPYIKRKAEEWRVTEDEARYILREDEKVAP